MTTENPLFEPFELPPFSRIANGHYLPAIERGIALGLAEVDAIVANPEAPTFANTIEALERAGQELNRTLGVFFPLLSANADDKMMELSMKASALLSDYSSKVALNEPLFERIKVVAENPGELDDEQRMLLRNTRLDFVRSGADLQGADRERFREIKRRLSELSTLFGQNVKKELKTYALELTEEQTEGLPQWLLDAMAENARERQASAPFVLTLQAPEYQAFMKDSPFDDLRRHVYELYACRNTNGEFSNLEILREMANLRLEKARLLGYRSYAAFSLERTMAGTPERVYQMLSDLRQAYMPALRCEIAELEEFAGEGITAWNYSYHFNRLRKARFAYDSEELRPYFELNAVVGGVFGLAKRLYGIELKENPDVEVYHPDAKAFNVVDSDGSELGVLFADFFPRPGRKGPGAWMTDFREANAERRPIVNIVMNFTKPSGSRPSLLSPAEVTTFLHEFGHALHSLLTRARYSSLAGTNVDRDFVELPSQFNENFFYAREFLDSFARHYQTGEPLPNELFERLVAVQRFGAAHACIRQLNFGYIDMAFHSAEEPITDVEAIEKGAIVWLPESAPGALTAPSFGHIFSGGYAAGYYSYKWAERLDADAFDWFQQNGTFSPDLALSFRRNILEPGGTMPAAELYRRFRGQEPSVQALLRRDGIDPTV